MISNELFFQLIEPLFYVSDPQKRIFIVYLLASAGLALWVLWRNSELEKLKSLLHKKNWLDASVLLDVKLIFFNHALWVLLLAPLFSTQIALALFFYNLLSTLFGPGDFWQWPLLTVSIIYTVVLFVVDDFARFVVHWFYHKVPLLWRFHAVHHSATVLTPLTLYRVHFIEMIINALRSLLVSGLIGGGFIYCFEGKVTPLLILGVSMFSLAFNLAGSNLRHSSIYLGFGRVEKWVMSPAQHQIHHSAQSRHFDKNLGVMIALWDRVFGTWVSSETEQVTAYGIGYNAQVKQSLLHHLKGL